MVMQKTEGEGYEQGDYGYEACVPPVNSSETVVWLPQAHTHIYLCVNIINCQASSS